MTFNQQLDRIQAMIKHYEIYVPATRKMGSSEVHDLNFYINGVSLYCCVNYTRGEITWRNLDTGETVNM